jgi:hypothetical protein
VKSPTPEDSLKRTKTLGGKVRKGPSDFSATSESIVTIVSSEASAAGNMLTRTKTLRKVPVPIPEVESSDSDSEAGGDFLKRTKTLRKAVAHEVVEDSLVRTKTLRKHKSLASRAPDVSDLEIATPVNIKVKAPRVTINSPEVVDLESMSSVSVKTKPMEMGRQRSKSMNPLFADELKLSEKS